MASTVEVRTLAPPPPDDEHAQLLYRAVPQIEDPSQLKVKFKLYTPDQVRPLLLHADSDPEFHQRPLKTRDVHRWKLLMETDRFVNYLPNGPLCFDETGMLLNGKHRLSALVAQDKAFGFMVVERVPRWMFRFFDTMRVRSLNDIFAMAGRMTKAQSGSTMRLAMRYEEFLHGLRPPIGWREWHTQRDEHFDVDEFLLRREDLGDLYVAAEHVSRPAKLVISALMVFRFYQQLAWRDGDDALSAFWDGLKTGAMPPAAPSLTLRSWARDVHQDKERINQKREVHLLLLNRMFALHAQGDRVSKLTWAYGFPMTMPYHPGRPGGRRQERPRRAGRVGQGRPMNNMAHKRRRWRRWEKYVRRCLRLGGRHRKPSGGLARYYTQRMTLHNRHVDRRNAEMFAAIESLTGLTRADLLDQTTPPDKGAYQ